MSDAPYRPELINAIVRLKVKPDRVEDFKTYCIAMLPDTIAHDGCGYMALTQQIDDPTIFYFFERWTSKEKMDQYLAWRGERGDGQKIMDMLDGPQDFQLARTVWLPPSSGK